MKNILTLLFTFWTFFCEAQHTFFQFNSNYVAPSLAVLTSTSASSIGTYSATSGGTISKDGGSYVTSRGVVWSTSESPTIESSSITLDGSGIGSFTSSITGLDPVTTYYIRAFAINSVGTSYGNQTSLRTSETLSTVYNSATGKTWMDRNLGATQVATSLNDVLAYGDLYQWGRGKDGHELRTSGTISTQSESDIPGNNLFIINNNDWRSSPNDKLWQGVNGINNPCPAGFRLPNLSEWVEEINSWSNKNSNGAFSSLLKLTNSGYRSDGTVVSSSNNTAGFYWTSSNSTTDPTYLSYLEDKDTYAILINIHSSQAARASRIKSFGATCRCIQNY